MIYRPPFALLEERDVTQQYTAFRRKVENQEHHEYINTKNKDSTQDNSDVIMENIEDRPDPPSDSAFIIPWFRQNSHPIMEDYEHECTSNMNPSILNNKENLLVGRRRFNYH